MMTGGDGGESWDVGTGAGLVDRPSTGYGGEAGARVGNTGGEASVGGLGILSAEGTAVSDDEDSAWEDCEATRLFSAYQESVGHRT